MCLVIKAENDGGKCGLKWQCIAIATFSIAFFSTFPITFNASLHIVMFFNN